MADLAGLAGLSGLAELSGQPFEEARKPIMQVDLIKKTAAWCDRFKINLNDRSRHRIDPEVEKLRSNGRGCVRIA